MPFEGAERIPYFNAFAFPNIRFERGLDLRGEKLIFGETYGPFSVLQAMIELEQDLQAFLFPFAALVDFIENKNEDDFSTGQDPLGQSFHLRQPCRRFVAASIVAKRQKRLSKKCNLSRQERKDARKRIPWRQCALCRPVIPPGADHPGKGLLAEVLGFGGVHDRAVDEIKERLFMSVIEHLKGAVLPTIPEH
jgi:hypothetical protein